jgi:hypothetical protein
MSTGSLSNGNCGLAAIMVAEADTIRRLAKVLLSRVIIG